MGFLRTFSPLPDLEFSFLFSLSLSSVLIHTLRAISNEESKKRTCRKGGIYRG